MSPTGKSDSFRSCVRTKLRACERSCACAGESVPQSAGLGELKMSSGARFAPEFCRGFKKVMKCDQQSRGFKQIDDIRSTVQGF